MRQRTGRKAVRPIVGPSNERIKWLNLTARTVGILSYHLNRGLIDFHTGDARLVYWAPRIEPA